jgi:hypothetical protein
MERSETVDDLEIGKIPRPFHAHTVMDRDFCFRTCS